jgi:Na+-transporting NADH:ubiquinone oxidoreductase subunit B
MGEGAIFLIVAAAVWLLATKTANWRMMLNTLLSAALLSAILYWSGVMKTHLPLMSPDGKDFGAQCLDLLRFMMSGSLLFVAVFMATDPITAPKKALAQFFYGWIIGSVTILVRCFTGFPEGTSFAILTANTFGPLIDELLPARKAAPRPAASPAAKPTEAKP